jgi:hypothetical protein
MFTVASGWDNEGGVASSWNDNEGGAATNGNNLGEEHGDNFNDGFGGDVGGERRASDGACRRCGQGKSSPYLTRASVQLICHQRATLPTKVTKFVLITVVGV